jgi:hypothetical protein
MLSTFECYKKALRTPQLKLSQSSDMLLSYEFAQLYAYYYRSIHPSCLFNWSIRSSRKEN